MAGFLIIVEAAPHMKLLRSERSFAAGDKGLSFDSHSAAHDEPVHHTENPPLTGLRAEIVEDPSV